MIYARKINKKLSLLKKKIKNPNFLHKPYIKKNDLKFLTKTVLNSEVSTYGSYTKYFENKIGSYLNSENIVSSVNGTSALYAVLSYLKVNSKIEVLVQSFTFVATVNPIIHLGGEPHFVDISEESLSVDPIKLDKYLSSKKFKFHKGRLINRTTNKLVKILLITHSYGYPAEIEKLSKIAKKYKLILIEDAAETLGTMYKKKNLGTYGDYAILSFNGNKTITTGGGGLIIAKKKRDIINISHLITTSKVLKNYDVDYDSAGFNLRMPSLNAALGLSQLNKIDKILKLKRRLFNFYEKFFKDFPHVKIYKGFDKECKNNFWIILLKIDTNKLNKTHFLYSSKKLNLEIKQVWKPLHKMKYLKNYQKMNLNNSNHIYKCTLCLPSSAGNI